MATQQIDALVLPCDRVAEPGAPSETIRRTFQSGGTFAGAVHAQGVALAEFPAATFTPDGSQAASLTSGIGDEHDTVGNELACLYACFSVYCAGAKYHEFLEEEDARRASCRWPLLVEARGVRTWTSENGPSC